ncbi:MAG: hypothetical protein FWC50_05840 [Planctomycetaceae bacterium]|nr:hypothetical protein [Planctomycetaceae bacterium]
MTTITELLTHYENTELHPLVVDMAGALLEWGTRLPDLEIRTLSATDDDYDPFKNKRDKNPKPPTKSEPELLVNVLELTAQAFRLRSSTSPEAGDLAEKTTKLAKYVMELAEGRIDTLKIELESLRNLTDTFVVLDKDLKTQRETKEEREAEIERKKGERDALKSKVSNLDATRQEIVQDIEKLEKQLKKLEDDKAEIVTRKQKAETSLQEFTKLKQELEDMEQKNENAQSEKNKIEKRRSSLKRQYEETREFIEEMDNYVQLESDMANHIRSIWQSLPHDEIDKKINLNT